MTDEQDPFCPVCQLVVADCPGHDVPDPISLHSLSVTSTPQNVNGDSGDSGGPPPGGRTDSANLPAVTAVTQQSDRRGRHERAVTAAGDTYRGSVTGQNGQRRISWTAADLLAEEFAEPKWAVPGLLPEGLTLLAGAPKVGKSWLCLGLALAVAAGGRA